MYVFWEVKILFFKSQPKVEFFFRFLAKSYFTVYNIYVSCLFLVFFLEKKLYGRYEESFNSNANNDCVG